MASPRPIVASLKPFKVLFDEFFVPCNCLLSLLMTSSSSLSSMAKGIASAWPFICCFLASSLLSLLLSELASLLLLFLILLLTALLEFDSSLAEEDVHLTLSGVDFEEEEEEEKEGEEEDFVAQDSAADGGSVSVPAVDAEK